MDVINVNVTTRHFKKAVHYSLTGKCPLAYALKLKFPKTEICVGGMTVDIYHNPAKATNYRIYNWLEATYTKNIVEVCEQHINDAQMGLKVPTYYVQLKRT